MRKDKIFVVNYNKHATTAIHHMFRINDYRGHHGVNWWINRGGSQAKKIIEKHDICSDGHPTSHAGELDWLLEQYPDCKFILPVRCLRAWVISRFRHGQRMYDGWKSGRIKNPSAWEWAYPADAEKVKQWLEQINQHVENVFMSMRMCPERLWVVEINNTNNWEQYIREEFKLTTIDSKRRNITPRDERLHSKLNSLVDNIDGLCVDTLSGEYQDMLVSQCKQYKFNTNLI